MINQNQYFVTIAVQQKEGEIAFYEIKKPIEPLAIKEKTFELFEVISKLDKTDDVILYPIMFLITSYTPKSAVERLIITTARKYYNPSEKVVAVAVEYGLNSTLVEKDSNTCKIIYPKTEAHTLSEHSIRNLEILLAQYRSVL